MNRRFYVTLAVIFMMCGMNSMATNKVLRIMPLGDSITFGSNYPGSYRVHLEELLAQKNVTAHFVGSQINGPAKLKSKHNEGHSGWKIQDIAGRIDGWLANSKPDIVLLMIGTNDIWVRQTGWVPDLILDLQNEQNLINKILAGSATRKVVVATVPLANQPWNHFVVTYNDTLHEAIIHRADFGRRVFFADTYSALTKNDLDPADGVHPAPSGHDHIAEAWFQVLRQF